MELRAFQRSRKHKSFEKEKKKGRTAISAARIRELLRRPSGCGHTVVGRLKAGRQGLVEEKKKPSEKREGGPKRQNDVKIM